MCRLYKLINLNFTINRICRFPFYFHQMVFLEVLCPFVSKTVGSQARKIQAFKNPVRGLFGEIATLNYRRKINVLKTSEITVSKE